MMGLNTHIAGPCLLLTALVWKCEGNCPSDTAARARQCFANFTWGVAPSDDDNGLNDILHGGGSDSVEPRGGAHQESGVGGLVGEGVSGVTVPLDYRKIREYCAEGGHMLRFVHCVEELSQYCPDLPPDGAFGQLINPQRVRTSVPDLCSSKDAIEEQSECMNRVMNQRSPCKERAFNSILPGPSRTILSGNGSQTSFFMQCRYLSVLAECQRTAISEACGGHHLGNLHANFLLSFVPAFCNPHSPPGGAGEGEEEPPRQPHRRRPYGPGRWKGSSGRSDMMMPPPPTKKKTGGGHIIPGRKSSRDKPGGGGTNLTEEVEAGGVFQEGEEGTLSELQILPDKMHVQPGARAGRSGGQRSPPSSSSLDHQETTRQTETNPQLTAVSTPIEPAPGIPGPVIGAVVQEVTSSEGEMTSVIAVAPTKPYESNSTLRLKNTSGTAAAVVIVRETLPMAWVMVVSLCMLFGF